MLRGFVPDFPQLYRQELTGGDEFHLKGGRLRMYASYDRLTLELSLSFDDVVRVLMVLYKELSES